MISNQIEKKQKIKWDEETIAEHDKERGTRYLLFIFKHFHLIKKYL